MLWYRSLLLLLFISYQSVAVPRLNSAVSANFPDGLHAHFIRYFCEQLGAEVDIALMPYARRLIELNGGTIDLMVGVSAVAPVGGNTILLQPAYDTLRAGIFVLNGNQGLFTKPEHLRERLISLTRHANSDSILQNIPAGNIVPARSLEQKIELLLKGRIDGFIHIAASTELKLAHLGLTSKIVPATYQPQKVYEQYIAINKSSWLFHHKDKLEEIIRAGITSGELQQIRYRYYAQNQ